MGASVKTGSYVHVVATLNVESGEGHIRYVNPVEKVLESDAAPDPAARLIAKDASGATLYEANVVLRKSSSEQGQSNDVRLIQADIPRLEGMAALELTYRDRLVANYVAGALPVQADSGGMTLSLDAGPPEAANRQVMTVGELAETASVPGVTYTVQVRPEGNEAWSTIAVGRPTPKLEIDRNQFPGARRADVRVLRTDGFNSELVAAETIEL